MKLTAREKDGLKLIATLCVFWIVSVIIAVGLLGPLIYG